MKIHHINCGTLRPPFARFVTGRGRLLERAKVVCHCLVLETKDGLILVDTGIGTSDIDRPSKRLGAMFISVLGPVLSREETALQQVATLGFSSKDVRHIILTHLDEDHVGGLSNFPDATVHVLEAEKNDALNPRTLNAKRRYRQNQFSHGVKWQVHEAGGDRWFGFESVRPLPGSDDEILLIPLSGHSRGHCGVAVKTDKGWLLHAGDAYYAHSEIYGDPPSIPPGIAFFEWFMQNDGASCRNSQRRLIDLVHSQGASIQLICTHDATEMDLSFLCP